MKNFLVNYSIKGPDSIDSDVFLKEKLIQIRRTISNLIHCRPEEIVFTQSTTDGVNMVATGLSFDSKSNVVIRGMAHEHHANYYPWLRLSQKLSLKSLKTDLNGFFDIKELHNLVDKNTKCVALSHALYNTGVILPVEEIGEYLEKNNVPYFIDTAQTVGCFGEYDFKKTKSNFMSFNGSKWLCGPMGTGIFYCKIMKLSNQMREELSKISGITLFGPEEQSKRTGIVSFSIDGQEPQKIVELLEKKKIVIAVREIVDKKILRASPHFFNSEEEIQKVVNEIRKL